MNRFFSVVAIAAAAVVFAVGCGGEQDLGLQSGDKLVVTERFERARFEASYGEGIRAITHTNGAFVEIPEGTVMEVFVTPRRGAATIEVIPVQAVIQQRDEEGAVREVTVTDADELRNHFVQARYLTHDFIYYSFSFPAEYLGTKLKKQ